MAISYPLSLPTTIGFERINFSALNAVAISQSPFTFQQKTYVYSGQMWKAEVSIPPVKEDLAESWVAFLLSLRGQAGTFYLNDPLNPTPKGTATTLTVSGSAGDSSVSATLNGTLKAGDWFSLGNGSAKRLHKVVQNISATGTMEIYPSLRQNYTSEVADLTSASGVFRLNNNQTSWSIGNTNSYGISFEAVEAL
jgi:hypothetical protein